MSIAKVTIIPDFPNRLRKTNLTVLKRMEYNVKSCSKKESVLHEKTTELSEVSDNQIFQTIQLLIMPSF